MSTGKRGRRPTAEKSISERILPRLSRRREQEEIKRMAENMARKKSGLPPLPVAQKRHSETENMRIANECMRFLWEREHVWAARAGIVADICRWVDERKAKNGNEATRIDWDRLAERMTRYIDKDRKVRVWRPGMKLRSGEIIMRYRPGDYAEGPEPDVAYTLPEFSRVNTAPTMIFGLMI
jgi:hypothetical protein